MSLDAPTLLESIGRHLSQRTDRSPILAYWYQVPGSRTEFASAIREAADGRFVPLVVTGRFQNENGLMSDLRQLIIDNRVVLDNVPMPTPEQPLVLVLLSYAEFHLPQAASPTALPDWFPGMGGQTVSVWVEDLTWEAEIPVNAPLVRTDELRMRLYELDRTLTRRLVQSAEASHNNTSGLFQEIQDKVGFKSPHQKVSDLLSTAATTLGQASNVTGYRLELKKPETALGCLIRLTSVTPPDGLGALAKQMSRAIVIPTGLVWPPESFLATLSCSTNREKTTPPDVLFGWNLLLTAYSAHRLSTVSAHADDYPAYPAPLLRSVVLELRVSRARCAEFIDCLPPITGPK